MLIRLTEDEGLEYIELAYKLAMDQSRSAYPTYTDGIKNKTDFEKFFRSGFRDVYRGSFLYMEDNIPMGWIQYSTWDEDRYLATEIFNIAGNIRQALSEFLAFCEREYSGFMLNFGFPTANTEAVAYLKECGLECIENSNNDVFFLDHYQSGDDFEGVERVTCDNFQDFRSIHSLIEEDMFWTSERLYRDLDNWTIFLHRRENVPVGAIYYRIYTDTFAEIFGVDFARAEYDAEVFQIMVRTVLNQCKRTGIKYIVYFNEPDTQQAALDIGFTDIGGYMLFQKRV